MRASGSSSRRVGSRTPGIWKPLWPHRESFLDFHASGGVQNDDIQTPTLYDYAHEHGLSTFNIHQFYNRSLNQAGSWDEVYDGDLDNIDDSWGRPTFQDVRDFKLPDPDDNRLFDRRAFNKARAFLQANGLPSVFTIYAAAIDGDCHKFRDHGFNGVDAAQFAGLQFLDGEITRFVSQLEQQHPEIYEKTLFFLIADHGHTENEAGRKIDLGTLRFPGESTPGDLVPGEGERLHGASVPAGRRLEGHPDFGADRRLHDGDAAVRHLSLGQSPVGRRRPAVRHARPTRVPELGRHRLGGLSAERAGRQRVRVRRCPPPHRAPAAHFPCRRRDPGSRSERPARQEPRLHRQPVHARQPVPGGLGDALLRVGRAVERQARRGRLGPDQGGRHRRPHGDRDELAAHLPAARGAAGRQAAVRRGPEHQPRGFRDVEEDRIVRRFEILFGRRV